MQLKVGHFIQFFKGQSVGRMVFIVGIIPFGVFAGVGMIRGVAWAWHAGQLYIFVNAYSFFRAWLVHGNSPEAGPIAVTAVYLICAAYLFTRRPREYFGLSCAAAIWSGVTGPILAIGIYHVLTWIPVPFM